MSSSTTNPEQHTRLIIGVNTATSNTKLNELTKSIYSAITPRNCASLAGPTLCQFIEDSASPHPYPAPIPHHSIKSKIHHLPSWCFDVPLQLICSSGARAVQYPGRISTVSGANLISAALCRDLIVNIEPYNGPSLQSGASSWRPLGQVTLRWNVRNDVEHHLHRDWPIRPKELSVDEVQEEVSGQTLFLVQHREVTELVLGVPFVQEWVEFCLDDNSTGCGFQAPSAGFIRSD